MTGTPDLAKARKTGPDRNWIPRYVDRLPPCNAACPAGENIQAWLALSQAGKFREAWDVIVRDNPFPAIHGRVCYHKCESVCNRKYLDDAVSIHAVERFLGDKAIEEGWQVRQDAAETGRKVLVIGAGPSGLSAAYHLRRLGHQVEIRDAGPIAGGMLRFGIPAYRLPRTILDAEVARLEQMGIKFTLNHKVEDVDAEMKDGAFDAVFVAVGAHLSRRTNIPTREAGAILDAVSFLRGMETGERPVIGRRVAIYGGGNTAMDAARTAKRLGAEEALIIYRRDRTKAPAHDDEIDDALAEGIKIHWLRTIAGVDGGKMTVEKMQLDASGSPQPTGEFEELEADSVVLALGQVSDTEFLKHAPGVEFKRDGTVIVDKQMMTGCSGIFAGGDMVPDERSVTVATGHGKKAARCIDAWLRSQVVQKAPRHSVVNFTDLHPWYFTDADKSDQPRIDMERRRVTFDEVVGSLSEQDAQFESRRCLSCGNCYECDGCLGACPEDAVIKLGEGNRYKFDYDKCIGCGACFDQCPCGAIELLQEPTPINSNGTH